ncbi:MAG: flagellar hook capping FlgD N-terminal domain-containing protein [Phycisphaerales bacterium]
MATIDAISASASGSSAGNSAFSALSSEDFTKIILQELSRQDPLQPSDTSTLIQQLSGLRSIQSDMDLGDKLQDLVRQNEFASATTLLGTRVTGRSIDNIEVEGVVKSVVRSSYGAVVTLGDSTRMLVSDIDQIVRPEPEDAE